MHICKMEYWSLEKFSFHIFTSNFVEQLIMCLVIYLIGYKVQIRGEMLVLDNGLLTQLVISCLVVEL